MDESYYLGSIGMENIAAKREQAKERKKATANDKQIAAAMRPAVEQIITMIDQDIEAAHAIKPYLQAATRNPFKRNKEIWQEFRARELFVQKMQITRRKLKHMVELAEKDL